MLTMHIITSLKSIILINFYDNTIRYKNIIERIIKHAIQKKTTKKLSFFLSY